MNDHKVLIAYFSRGGENYVNGSIQELAVGNTDVAAHMLQELTSADICEIKAERKYSTNYLKCVEQAKRELATNARPNLKEMSETMDAYDTIYLGYPIWCGTCPMPVLTFLDSYDFSGKTIKPFCTNEGSGLGNSVVDIKNECKVANVEEGLSLRGANIQDAKEKLDQWK